MKQRVLGLEQLSEWNEPLVEILEERFKIKDIVVDFTSNDSPLVDIRGVKRLGGKLLVTSVPINSLDEFIHETTVDAIISGMQLADSKPKRKKRKK